MTGVAMSLSTEHVLEKHLMLETNVPRKSIEDVNENCTKETIANRAKQKRTQKHLKTCRNPTYQLLNLNFITSFHLFHVLLINWLFIWTFFK